MATVVVAPGAPTDEQEVDSLKAPATASSQKRPSSDVQSAFASKCTAFLAAKDAWAAKALGVDGLTASEKALETSVLVPARTKSGIDPARNFLDYKADYDASPLLPVLQRMPKGAVLHTHGIASGNFTSLVEVLQRDGHFYVWRGDDSVPEGTMRPFSAAAAASRPEGWVPVQDRPKEELYKLLTLAPNLGTVERCWQEFGKIWERVRAVAGVAPFYYGRNGYFWSILGHVKASNVAYLEIKEPVFAPWTDYDGKALSDEEWLQVFIGTVTEFQKESPGFLGARLVLTALKVQSVEDVRQAYRRSAALKEKFPEYVAGFDMAGPEDILAPIATFARALEEEREVARRRGVDLPLLLHAGETNVPDAEQVYDAVALGCQRIGHGFALARHPALVAEILATERPISLECCPISNQVLGYCPNLANHAALGLMRAGVPLTISPDDPGMWHYSDVSYDYAAVTRAWNLSLLELKALARNSIAYSTLEGAHKEKALKAWEEDWHKWVGDELRRVRGAPP